MKFIICIFLFFSCIANAEDLEFDFDCIGQAPESLKLPDLSRSESSDEFRIYECLSFGLDVSLSKIIRFYPNYELDSFGLPTYKSATEVGRIKVIEYVIPEKFDEVFRFQEWKADYISNVSDGVWYELQYNWKGIQGSAFFNNPNYGADIDAQMLSRLIELVRN